MKERAEATVIVGFRKFLGAVVTWLLCFCCVGQARAIDASIPLNLLERTSFHAREGAPGDIQAAVQASDGNLWLGTSGGLYEFDGVSFRQYKPPGLEHLPDSNIAALVAAPGGGLWATTRFGHVYFITRKSLRVFGPAEGLPEHTLYGLAVGPAGQVWVGSTFGVFRLDRGHWVMIPNSDGTPSSAADFDCLKLDGHGNLWMTDHQRLSVLRPNADRVTAVRAVKTPQGIFLDGQGEAWLSDEKGIYSLSDSRVGIPISRLPGPAQGVLEHPFIYFIDSAETAWGLTARGEGFRIPLPRIAHTVESARLAGAPATDTERILHIDVAIRPFWLEDLEGNVWITSSSGLERFRATKFRRVVIDGNAVGAGALAVASAGVLWTQSAVGLYKRIAGERFTKVDIGKVVRCPTCPVFASKDGTLYKGSKTELQRLGRSGFEPASQPVDQTQEGFFHAISEDDDGRLWVSVTHGKGTFTLSGGKWERFETGVGYPEAALSITSAGGRMWLGFLHGTVIVVHGGQVRRLTQKDGLSIGDVLVVAAQGRATWLAGTGGLAYFDGDRVHTVLARARPWIGVSGLVLTSEGDLWLNTDEGVHRIPKEELAAFLDDPKHPVADELFDVHAGIEGTPVQYEPIPTAAKTPDGLLWFSTSAGLFSVDPRHIRSNHVAPQVAVLNVQSDGAQFSGSSVTLPPGSSAIEISYSAPVLAVPEQARFKYRLEGVDAAWQDAGGRRSAFYTNVAPGSYHFQVMAANEDGVWSERAAEVVIAIAPTFWQTAWFRGGMIATGAALVVLTGLLWHRVRVGRLSRALRLESDIQQAERERIARDLHDTLLQNMYALVWRLDVISRTFAADDNRRAEMEEALDRAEKALGAGRQRIFSPQQPEHEADQTFVERLRELGRAWSANTGVGFAIDVGDESPLRSDVVSLLERILSEAIVNAFRHAGASQVRLKLQFGGDELLCVVSDDGGGIPFEFMERPPDGHLGLRLMRDRATTLGANLLIRHGANGGSEIVFAMPAGKAYARGRFMRRLANGLRFLRDQSSRSSEIPDSVATVGR